MRAKIMQTVFRLMILSVMLVGSSVNAEIEAAQDSYGGKSILFWSPEQQRLGYGSMADIFPTRRVVANTQAVPLEMAAAEQLIDGSFEYVVPFGEKTQTVDGGVDAFMQRMRTAGLIVVKDGEVRLERYGLGHNAQRPWVSFSVTKSVVSMLVGAAIKDGFINSVDDPVTDYLPHLRNGAYAGVSVGQLLQMSSGVKWNEDYTDPQADVAGSAIGWNATVQIYERFASGCGARPGV
jgi:CubicO group peptidase (beta-lactamase class C family)